MRKKKCPLRYDEVEMEDCIEEQCAWWIHGEGACAIKVMAQAQYNKNIK